MDQAVLRGRIRTMVETGALPCDDTEQLWGGRGDGTRCSGCLEPISPPEIEYEVKLTSGVTIHLHRICHAVWLEECRSQISP